MTAFARAEVGAIVWEMRSVNHRYLDISFRMPDNYRQLENTLKGMFRDRVHRGKVECSLKINPSELPSQITVNERLLAELSDALDKVVGATGVTDRGDALSLLRWPDVLKSESNAEDLVTDIKTGFELAVDQLVEMRVREGAELAELLETRLRDVEVTVVQVREAAPEILASQHEKIRGRLDDLQADVDPARLEQELVILAQKSDVLEELDRLDTHVAEVRRNLEVEEPVGRRLDFLMQELNREANTLSSKAQVSGTTLHAVDLKVVIEQMREQIQNIE
jgi:uncharacterized protein (TIGR00255 family)